MHLRNAACKGAHYHTDWSDTPHGPHEFFPHEWGTATPCHGWTVWEFEARAITDLLMNLADHDFERGGASLHCGWRVSQAIDDLLTPDYPGEDAAGIGHQIARLYGVPIIPVPGDGGRWRLNAGLRLDGDGVIAEGVINGA